jgi:hypothetical protein
LVASNCAWWGPPDCQTQDVPTSCGAKIIDNNSGVNQFFTIFNDTLTFNFNMSIGDTSLFYQNSIEKFSFTFERIDTFLILNNIDSARFYKIIHTDTSGNVINSILNNQEIIVAKDWGLVQFFRVDSFPSILLPVTLSGITNPDGGLFKFTNEVLYDFQPGDKIQSNIWYWQPGGPPWNNFNRYELITVLNRTNTVDSIIYEVEKNTFDAVANTFLIDTVFLRYARHIVISQIPFEFFDGNERSLFMSNYCGLDLWTYYIKPFPYIGYCAAENCWGQIDTGGPVATGSTTYVAGLGIYDSQYSLAQPPPIGYGTGTQIVYFEKNGLPCGTLFTNVQKNSTSDNYLTVFPIPSDKNGELTFSYPSTGGQKEIVIYDINGKEVTRYALPQWSTTQKIKLPELSSGVYVARLISNSQHQISNVKFVVE